MSTYIGPLEGFGRFDCFSDITDTSVRKDIDRVDIDGTPYTTRVGSTWREWSLTIDNEDLAALSRLRQAVDGQRSPWVFLPPNATEQNVLTPHLVRFLGWRQSGAGSPLEIMEPSFVDGIFTPAIAFAGAGIYLDSSRHLSPPFCIGPQMTVALYQRRSTLATAPQFRVVWCDGQGNALPQHQPTDWFTGRAADSTVWVRNIATITRPTSGRVPRSARIEIRRASMVALPQVTWTTTEREWIDGQGCMSAMFGFTTYAPFYLVSGAESGALSLSVREVA